MKHDYKGDLAWDDSFDRAAAQERIDVKVGRGCNLMFWAAFAVLAALIAWRAWHHS